MSEGTDRILGSLYSDTLKRRNGKVLRNLYNTGRVDKETSINLRKQATAQAGIDRRVNAIKERQTREAEAAQKKIDRQAEHESRRLHGANAKALQQLHETSNIAKRIKIIRDVEDRNQEASGEERPIAVAAIRNAVDRVSSADYQWKNPGGSGASIASSGLSAIGRQGGIVGTSPSDPRSVIVGDVRQMAGGQQVQQGPLPGLNDSMFFIRGNFVSDGGPRAQPQKKRNNIDDFASRLLGV